MAQSGPQSPPVALVTGASRGIGREVAIRLGELGFAVAVNYRSAKEQAEDVVRQIEERGGKAVALAADMSVDSQAARLLALTECEFGHPDILINNAGITRDRLVLQMSEADWGATWSTNLAGARSVGRAVLRSMIARGCRGGRIVNVSSVVGSTGNAGQANYAASKSALHGLTREWAVQGAPYGIAVNCVVPGYIVTDATSHFSQQQRDTWLGRIPMRRSATPAEVSDAIVFLASGPSAYITGQCLAVDGGLLAAAEAGYVA